MGEAKQKEDRLQLVKDFEATERELMGLTLYFLNGVAPKDQRDIRRYNRVFTQLGLERYEGRDSVKLTDYPETKRSCSATVDTVEYILSTIPREPHQPGIPGNLTRALGRLFDLFEEMLKQ